MKRWYLYPEREESLALVKTLGVSPILAKILINRGMEEVSEAEKFLFPKLTDLKDPFDIPNIRTAALRVLRARDLKEKVLVFGDYDVDGVTGTAILIHTLKLLGLEVSYYIPHRYGEGYSLSLEAVRKIAESGVKLIITVDCGIASAIEVEEANALGTEVIVTDHHQLPARLPAAFAIVNPKQIVGYHPSKNLSGAGVAFKFAWALLREAGIKDSIFLTSLLDLAGLGTISDVVPLTGENRVLAAVGLRWLNERKRVGLKHLAEAASLYGPLNENHIYFGLGPRLNAAGRLAHASKSVELLLAEDPVLAQQIALELNRINGERQDLGALVKEEVLSQIDQEYLEQNKLILLWGEGWHPGVIGIVAQQLVELYYRPTVLVGVKDGVGRGSARSIEGLNIYELLDSCRDLFWDFGGHEGAAGFEIPSENISELNRRLRMEADQILQPEDLIGKIKIDAEIPPAYITLNLVKELERLAPFGEGNPEPVFMMRGVSLSDFKQVGSEGKHLKLWFKKEGLGFEAIGFGLGKFAEEISFSKNYDLVFNLETSDYNGFEEVQISLIDLREAGL